MSDLDWLVMVILVLGGAWALVTEGHKPQLTPIPRKVQGGYPGPSGGKPAAPTTGSGVAPAAPSGGEKK